MLVVFVNIIYDVTPNADSAVVSNNNWAWLPDTIGGINNVPPVGYFNEVWDNEDTSSYIYIQDLCLNALLTPL